MAQRKSSHSQTLVAGRQAVLAALRDHGELLSTLYLSRARTDPQREAALLLAREKSVRVRFSPKKHLDRLAPGLKHQGMVAVRTAWPFTPLEKLLHRIPGEAGLFMALDGIHDPHNLGSLIRTAAAFGCRGIILPKDGSPPLSPTVAKVACGALEKVPVARTTNLVRTLAELKRHGFWIMGAEPAEQASIYSVDLTVDLVLVLGREDRGLRRLVRETCDILFAIPLSREMESLNLSVAGGIILGEAARQRALPPPPPNV